MHVTPTPWTRAAGVIALCALSACVSTGDYTEFGQEAADACVARACDTLIVDGLGLRDYAQIAAMDHVTSVMVTRTDFHSLTDIAGMTQLRGLHIGHTQVRDLSGLTAFANLEIVHMQGVGADALASARFPQGVRELAVGGPGLSELSVVNRTPNVQRLHVDTLAVGADLSALEGHRALHTVHLGDVGGMELAPLLAMPALREVSLSLHPGAMNPAQASVIAALRARGVNVSAEEIVVPVC